MCFWLHFVDFIPMQCAGNQTEVVSNISAECKPAGWLGILMDVGSRGSSAGAEILNLLFSVMKFSSFLIYHEN